MLCQIKKFERELGGRNHVSCSENSIAFDVPLKLQVQNDMKSFIAAFERAANTRKIAVYRFLISVAVAEL